MSTITRTSILGVNSTQLLKAAKLLKGADPSVCNGISQERPGYLSEDPNDAGVVVLTIGILSTETHRINRRGKVEV